MGSLLQFILLLISRRNKARLNGMVSSESMMKEILCGWKDIPAHFKPCFLDMAAETEQKNRFCSPLCCWGGGERMDPDLHMSKVAGLNTILGLSKCSEASWFWILKTSPPSLNPLALAYESVTPGKEQNDAPGVTTGNYITLVFSFSWGFFVS